MLSSFSIFCNLHFWRLAVPSLRLEAGGFPPPSRLWAGRAAHRGQPHPGGSSSARPPDCPCRPATMTDRSTTLGCRCSPSMCSRRPPSRSSSRLSGCRNRRVQGAGSSMAGCGSTHHTLDHRNRRRCTAPRSSSQPQLRGQGGLSWPMPAGGHRRAPLPLPAVRTEQAVGVGADNTGGASHPDDRRRGRRHGQHSWPFQRLRWRPALGRTTVDRLHLLRSHRLRSTGVGIHPSFGAALSADQTAGHGPCYLAGSLLLRHARCARTHKPVRLAALILITCFTSASEGRNAATAATKTAA